MKKWWAKFLIAFAVIVLLLSALFFSAGSDSKKLLEEYRNQLLASGEKLNLEDFIPSRLDAEKNGAALFEEAARSIPRWGTTAISTNPPVAMNLVAPGKAGIAWQQSEIVSWRRGKWVTNTWTEIGEHLTNQESALNTLQQAAKCPQFDFELDYRKIPIPTSHLSQLRDAASLLSAQAIFDLHRGDAAAATTHLQTLLAIADSCRDEPFSQTYRINTLQKTLAVQWELLQATNLTDEQLASLHARWTNVDVVGPMEKALQMIRFTSDAYLKLTRTEKPSFTPTGPGVPGSVFLGGSIRAFFESSRQRAGDALWRESWSYDDELRVWEGYQVMIETVRQAKTNGYFKDALAERERKIAALGLNRTNVNWLRTHLPARYQTTFGVQGLASQLDRVLATDAQRQCAIAAIALKRYELRHGARPKELSALVPEFLPALPRDPVDGKPLRYRLNPDGTFLLYSIGVDGIDNGGDATPIPPATSLWWETARDWVWSQPATAAEAQNFYDHPPK